MVIIFGYSKLAAQIAQSLKNKNRKIILVEPLEDLHKFAKADNYVDKIYNYECYDDNELINVGIATSKITTLFCLHNDENRNLFVTLSARYLNKNLQIIAMSHNKQETKKLKLAGATAIINPYETMALRAFRYIHRPRVLKILDNILYDDSLLNIQEILVESQSLLDGIYFKEANVIFDQYNLILLGIRDIERSNDFIFASRGINHKIDTGDTLVMVGYQNDIDDFAQHITKSIE